jgi:uncharacterized protein (DUF2342 family)
MPKSDPPGPSNRYFAERHARIALERLLDGDRNVEGHLRHVVYRLGKEIEQDYETFGRDWRKRRKHEPLPQMRSGRAGTRRARP